MAFINENICLCVQCSERGGYANLVMHYQVEKLYMIQISIKATNEN